MHNDWHQQTRYMIFCIWILKYKLLVKCLLKGAQKLLGIAATAEIWSFLKGLFRGFVALVDRGMNFL